MGMAADASGRDRYRVKVGSEVIALSPANVLLPLGSGVRVVGLATNQRWNGAFGLIAGIDREARRYSVQLDVDQVLRVRWDNVLL